MIFPDGDLPAPELQGCRRFVLLQTDELGPECSFQIVPNALLFKTLKLPFETARFTTVEVRY